MSPSLPAAILDTILGRLAVLFLTGTAGDSTAAHHAARQMLAAYHPQTEDELRLAAEIIGFSFHALDALSQASDPNISLNQKLHLRGSAVNLSRESHKSQRKLDQLQKAHRAGTPAQPVETPAPQAEPIRLNKDFALIDTARQGMASAGKNGGQTWTQGYQQRMTANRINANLKKNAAAQPVATATAQGPVLAG